MEEVFAVIGNTIDNCKKETRAENVLEKLKRKRNNE